MFKRIVEAKIKELMQKPELVILYGPRRVGKTTILKKIQQDLLVDVKSAFYSLDDPSSSVIFNDFSSVKLKKIFIEMGFDQGKVNYLFLDEIQSFKNVDKMFKIIYDLFPWVRIVATSSSSLLLLQDLTESLAGRKNFVELLPLTLSEETGVNSVGIIDRESLEIKFKDAMIYGLYPEVVLRLINEEKISKLRDLVDSALYKDVFILGKVKSPKILVTLIELLSLQIGNLVNLNELSQQLGVSRNTVDQYISILEKFFIIFRLKPFNKNLRNEINSKCKIYFWDLGIRNAVIQKFTPFEIRDDRGALFENMVILSMLKKNYYLNQPDKPFFWRTYDGAELDLVLENVTTGTLSIFQMSVSKKSRFTPSFDRYNPTEKTSISLSNVLEYCL